MVGTAWQVTHGSTYGTGPETVGVGLSGARDVRKQPAAARASEARRRLRASRTLRERRFAGPLPTVTVPDIHCAAVTTSLRLRSLTTVGGCSHNEGPSNIGPWASARSMQPARATLVVLL